MIGVLARLGRPETLGQYALGIAISVPILMLVPMDRRIAKGSDIRVMSLLFALLGIAAVGFLEQSVQDQAAVILVAMAQCVEGIAGHYEGRRSVTSVTLHGTLSIATLGGILGLTGRIGAALLGVLIVRLLALFLFDFRRHATRAPEDNSDFALHSFAANVPCYFVAFMLGNGSLGAYAAVASLVPCVKAIAGVIGDAAGPQLASRFQEGDQQGFSRLMLPWTAVAMTVGWSIGLCTALLSMLSGPGLLRLLFGADYADHSTVLLAMSTAAGGGFATSVLGRILRAGRRFDEIPLEVADVAVTSLACLFLVPLVGLPGAAFAAGLGQLIRIGGQLWIMQSLLSHPRKPVLLALLKEPLPQ